MSSEVRVLPRVSLLVLLVTSCASPGGGGGGGKGGGDDGDEYPASQRVLLIGNSQLGLNPPDVARGLAAISQAAFGGGSVLVVDRFQMFGFGCQEFAARGDDDGRWPNGLAAAAAGDYDVVVLLPAIGETRANEACWEQFRDAAEGAGARFGMMATADERGSFPAGFTSLHEHIGAYAADRGLLFVPAGDAWLRLLDENPGIDRKDLYSGDSSHPGVAGDMLYLYTLYGALTGRSTVGMPADVVEVRCAAANLADGSCLDRAALAACVDGNGFNRCDSSIVDRSPGNGMHFGPNDGGGGKIAFVTDADALAFQRAADAALAAIPRR
jgi:hypothetical protein